MKKLAPIFTISAIFFGCQADVDAPVDADMETNSNVTINNYGDVNNNVSNDSDKTTAKSSSSKKESASDEDEVIDELVVENISDLPRCSATRDGVIYTVTSKNKKVICEDGEWDFISEAKPTSSASSEDRGNEPGDNPSSSQTSQADGKSSSSQTTASGLLFNGADGTGADRIDFGNDLYGMWTAYHDDQSSFTWPAGMTNEISESGTKSVDFVVKSVNSYKALKGTANYYANYANSYWGYIGFVFEFIKNGVVTPTNITSWGGICIEYSSDRSFDFIVAKSNDTPPHVTIPAQTQKTVKNISWTEFGSSAISITTATQSTIRVGIQFGISSTVSTTTSFAIYKIGKYGTCN